jgi:Tfp pilus assembly protein PilF
MAGKRPGGAHLLRDSVQMRTRVRARAAVLLISIACACVGWGAVSTAHAQTSVQPFENLSLKVQWSGDDATPNQSSVGQLIDAGRNALAAGDAQTAAQDFTAALKQAPNDPALLNNLATARAMLGDNSGALQLLKRAVAIAPDREDIRNNLRILTEWMQKQTPGLDDENGPDGDRAFGRQGVTSGVQPW